MENSTENLLTIASNKLDYQDECINLYKRFIEESGQKKAFEEYISDKQNDLLIKYLTFKISLYDRLKYAKLSGESLSKDELNTFIESRNELVRAGIEV